MFSLSLTELCSRIEEVICDSLQPTYWVRAEIASLTTRGGHGYWELVEKGQSGILSAKVRATCWSSIYGMLQAYFREQTGVKLEVGMQVLVEVEVSFHAVYGLSLNIINIDPQYTTGDLKKQRDLTIQKLQQEGIWDMQRMLRLPTVIKRIAVISSSKAAGYEDFMHQLQASPYAFSTTLYEAIVQGEYAARSLISALNSVYEQADDYDIVVIIRGGGSTTDLTCFDSYEVAMYCAQFPLPIFTGIGHTKDISVTDMVVYSALKTPTAVADDLISRMDDQNKVLEQWRQRLVQTALRQILIRRHILELLHQRLTMRNPEHIYHMGYSLTTVNGRVVTSVKDVQSGDIITTHLNDGETQSTVL